VFSIYTKDFINRLHETGGGLDQTIALRVDHGWECENRDVIGEKTHKFRKKYMN
jgi:hypothetical protein